LIYGVILKQMTVDTWIFYWLFILEFSIHKVLSVGLKSLKMQYKAPDILLQYKLKNIKNTLAHFFL